MSSACFDWINFYTEFADKLLEYKDNRNELIEKINKIYNNLDDIKLPVLDQDFNGNAIDPEDIDPFSVYSLFNGKENVNKRIKIINEFKKEFSISADVPTTLEGISIMQVKRLFYWFEEGFQRPSEDIPNLWKLFDIAIKYSENQEANKESFIQIYNQVSKQKGIKKNITMALNWIRPNVFFNADGFTIKILKEKNLLEDIPNIDKLFEKTEIGEEYVDICNRLLEIFENTEEFKNFPQFSSYAYRMEKGIPLFDISNMTNDMPVKIGEGTNLLLYGVPGSGKSHSIKKFFEKYDVKEDQYERVIFYPDYTYSDFVGQILPKLTTNEQVKYEFVCGPFTSILRKAHKNPDKMFYLIIEEINRGNAPAIFGDIFQLLDRMEEDKDGLKKGDSEFSITNSDIAESIYTKSELEEYGNKIRIPYNLSIYATMNTSDQNVFTLDTAFQRRWKMQMVKNDWNDTNVQFEIKGTGMKWDVFAKGMNEFIIEKNKHGLSSEDKRLGAYFIKKEDFNENMKDSEIKKIFAEKVFKYLWDDAFKFRRDDVFDKEEVEQFTLEFFIDKFTNKETDDNRFSIFTNRARLYIGLDEKSNQGQEDDG